MNPPSLRDPARWRGVDVLLVEDEPIVSMMVEDLLSDIGCNVLIAGTVRDALDLLEHAWPSVAILDVNLGQEYAFPIAARLREAGVPFLFTTGYGRSRLLGDFRDCDVIQKPMESAALLALLAKLLHR